MAYRKQLYYRIQETGISFEDMQSYDSLDADETGESETGYVARPGLCVTANPLPGQFGGAWGAYDDEVGANPGEVVVMEGHVIEEIYDGYRIRPTREIARFSPSQWLEMLESDTLDETLESLQDQ